MSRSSIRRLLGLTALAAAAAISGGSGWAASNTVLPGGAITFADCCNDLGAATGPPSKASPYPSTIPSNISGTVGHVSVTVVLEHQWPDDVELLLVGPTGVKVLLMSDVGGGNGNAILPDTLRFDDAGVAVPDNTQLQDGTYRPTNNGTDCDNAETEGNFPAPAPAGPYGTALSAFNGLAAAGDWRLYAVDDCNLAIAGASIQSWSLDITGPTAVTMRSFTAARTSSGVLLRWGTASERRALGFHVYRFAGSKKVKVNRALIAAKQSGRARGAAYRLVDRRARRGASYTYRLQIVSLAGKRSWAATTAIRASKK